jgi:plasmid maintenance system antidote protein VapI
MKKIDTIKEKLQGKISSKKSKWLDDAKYSEENEAWFERSAQIALKILRHLRTNKISQIKLAESLLVSPQYVSKIVKGKENLSLETISKIEKALGISLIEVISFETKINVLDNMFRNQKGS